jgi:2-polyprenyl-6-hydroxyphenyl methylase/3-demethylubiquinone-9 3-methyltransferase
MSQKQRDEVAAGARFRFGENWARFLEDIDEVRLQKAEDSLRDMLGVVDLRGLHFLDIGSGSGLFSLAARRLGASVHSFDFDPESVACTRILREKYFAGDSEWHIEEGSVLEDSYMAALGTFDIVYSWGVLHHTGDMARALDNAAMAVSPGGKLFIALYNDQGLISRYWTFVKKAYNRNPLLQALMIVVHTPYLYCLRWLVRKLRGRSSVERGMALWRDMIDWLGGYPFEVSTPAQIFKLYRDRGFALQALVSCGGRMGCNEYVFERMKRERPSGAGKETEAS